MTSRLSVHDIEQLLRAAAHDEPANLPPLLLQTDLASLQAARRTSFRSIARLQAPSPILVVLGLLLALAAVVVAGAIRERDSDLTLIGLACDDDVAPAGEVCPGVVIPDGWTTLAAGQIHPGDVTVEGLGYETVHLLVASEPLGNCPTTPGPFPTPIPVGSNAYEQPVPTPDPGLFCLRDAALPANAIRFEVLHASRIQGVDAGIPIPDTSEPTVDAGWTEVVAGRPAKLSVAAGSGGDGAPDEIRTWDVLFPGSIDRVLRIRADIAGPDLVAGREAAARFVDSLDFGTDSTAFHESSADEVLGDVLDSLERTSRENRSDFYACFPREPGSAAGVISGGPDRAFARPLEVTCSTQISASVAEVWRIVLEVSWEATEAYAADTIRMELFASGAMAGDRYREWTGGYMTSLAGKSIHESDTWFPTGGLDELPPPLTGPLNLPAGSLVEILAPGELPRDDLSMLEPDGGTAPGLIGTHLWVIDGPEIIEGEEWYRVQNQTEQFPAIAWIRGTRDGRPQLAVVEPACPTGDVSVADLTQLIPAERLACFAGEDLVFEAAVVADNGSGEPMCLDEEGTSAECEDLARDWLVAFTNLELYDEAGPNGPSPPLMAWVDPALGEVPLGDVVRIEGRFDHPAAAECQWPDPLWEGPLFVEPPFGELVCRQRFVITSIEPR